jgi:hypothetical protein
MTVSLNHTIVWSSDQTKSSRFFADMLGRPPPIRYGHFDVVKLDNGVSLDFARSEGPSCAGKRSVENVRSGVMTHLIAVGGP